MNSARPPAQHPVRIPPAGGRALGCLQPVQENQLVDLPGLPTATGFLAQNRNVGIPAGQGITPCGRASAPHPARPVEIGPQQRERQSRCPLPSPGRVRARDATTWSRMARCAARPSGAVIEITQVHDVEMHCTAIPSCASCLSDHTSAEGNAMPGGEIVTVPCLSDNYAYSCMTSRTARPP